MQAARARGGLVGTAGLGVSRTALAAAAALHAACLGATVRFVHSTPPAAPAIEQVVQMAFVPAAVATPMKAKAVAASELEAAFPAPEPVPPELVPPEPAAPVALDQPGEPPLPEPVAAPPVAVAQTVEAGEEQPAETPAASPSVVTPPAPPPAQRQPQPSATRHAAGPQVAFSRGTPVHVPRQSSVSRMAAEAGAVRREAAQGLAHDMDQEASLEARIRDAVQAAVHYPAAARMMEVTGRARVQLDYRNGAVDGPLLAQSSGTPMLDQAALSAAQGAHYPATPPALAGRLMRFLVWVEFRAG